MATKETETSVRPQLRLFVRWIGALGRDLLVERRRLYLDDTVLGEFVESGGRLLSHLGSLAQERVADAAAAVVVKRSVGLKDHSHAIRDDLGVAHVWLWAAKAGIGPRDFLDGYNLDV